MRVNGVLFFFACLAVLGWIHQAVHAQGTDLKPTEVQQLRLEVKQKTALLAQRDVTDAQTRFNQALGELQDEAAKVEKENKWSDVQFDPQALTFKPMPKAAEKK